MAVDEGPFGTYSEVEITSVELALLNANLESFKALFGDPALVGDAATASPATTVHPDFDKISPATRVLIRAEIDAIIALNITS